MKQGGKFCDFYPLLPENALSIAKILIDKAPFHLSPVPFIENQPVPDGRFRRFEPESEKDYQAIKDRLKKWKKAELFFAFMRALDRKEAVSLYEEIFFGEEGVRKDLKLFEKLETVFLEGIFLLLQEKKVPGTRANTVKEGMKTLLECQEPDLRAKIWAHILAGIAQNLPLEEITREAARPLGSAGGKLMQAVHALTTGVDETLETATRLALDQTSRFSLLDSLQFLGWRVGDPFAFHDAYHGLGQGTVRAAVAGRGGKERDEAFLLVHTPKPDDEIIYNLCRFIRKIEEQGHYFPLTPNQFRGLARQTDEERQKGFMNHARFGELFNYRLGEIIIPRVVEDNGDWARVELMEGVPFSALNEEVKQKTASQVINAALSQFGKTIETEKYLVNPEFHFGNILVDEKGKISLVDCGLIGEAGKEDFLSFFSVLSEFRSHGLEGTAAALLKQGGISSLSQLGEEKSSRLREIAKKKKEQMQTGIPPELLLSDWTKAVAGLGGIRVSAGLEILFRGLQHLAPYLRLAGKNHQFGAFIPTSFDNDDALRKEIEQLLRAGNGEKKEISLPKGIMVGKVNKEGKAISLGILKEEASLEKLVDLYGTKMVKCQLNNGVTSYVPPKDLRIQSAKGEWISPVFGW